MAEQAVKLETMRDIAEHDCQASASPWRWCIVALLFLAAVLNYIDRTMLGILAPTIQHDLHIDDQQYAVIASWFMVAYSVSYLVSGSLVDRLGTRLSMACFIGFWSVSNVLTVFAGSARSLGFFRFLLGLGEAGGFTVSPKAVSEWFSARERGLAIGLYSVGGSVGATIAPLIVIFIADRWNWQAAFTVTGMLGLLWIVPWHYLYRHPGGRQDAGASKTAAEKVNMRGPKAPASPLGSWRQYAEAIQSRDVWVFMLARMLTDPLWYFYQFWMPKYLSRDRHLSQTELSLMWVIFLAADIGFLFGGWASGRIIAHGRTAPQGRLIIMLVCAVLVPLSPLVALLPGLKAALLIAMIVVGAHTAWLSNLTALIVDVLPQRRLAKAFGLIAAGSAVGGIFMNQCVASIIQRCTYQYCFYAMAVMHPLAWLLLICAGLGSRDKPQNVAESEASAVHLARDANER